MHAGLRWCTWPEAGHVGLVWCTWNGWAMHAGLRWFPWSGVEAMHVGLQTRNSHTLLDVLEKQLIVRLMLCVFIGLEKSVLRNC